MSPLDRYWYWTSKSPSMTSLDSLFQRVRITRRIVQRNPVTSSIPCSIWQEKLGVSVIKGELCVWVASLPQDLCFLYHMKKGEEHSLGFQGSQWNCKKDQRWKRVLVGTKKSKISRTFEALDTSRIPKRGTRLLGITYVSWEHLYQSKWDRGQWPKAKHIKIPLLQISKGWKLGHYIKLLSVDLLTPGRRWGLAADTLEIQNPGSKVSTEELWERLRE